MWEAIGYISSGATLIAFLAASIVTIFRRQLVHKENLINSAPENKRSELVQAALDSYSIESKDLTKQQRYELLMEQIKQREKRFKVTAFVIVILAFLSAALAAYAIGFKNSNGSTPERHSFTFNNKALPWAINHLDRKVSGFDIRLDPKIKSGEFKTKSFSVNIENATIEEILEIFCSKASDNNTLVWSKKGKIVIIEPLLEEKETNCYAKVEIYKNNNQSKYVFSRLYIEVTGNGESNQFPFSKNGISEISLSKKQKKSWKLKLISYDGVVHNKINLQGCLNEKTEIKLDENSQLILSPK